MLSLLALGAVVATLSVHHFRKPMELTFPEKVAFFQSEAVSMARESYGISLDYSPSSVKQVEEILGKLHDEYQRRGTTEGQRGLALAYGAYIGEVIRREAGEGRWAPDDPKFGVGTMPLYWRGHTTFPVTWCLKRLANGEEDNVWTKYQLIVHNPLQKKDA